MSRCVRCKKWNYESGACRCIGFLHRDDSDDEWDIGYAMDADTLAERLAEEYYNYDPGDPNVFEYNVWIVGEFEPKEKAMRIRVTAEAVVEFSAQEIDDRGEATS